MSSSASIIQTLRQPTSDFIEKCKTFDRQTIQDSVTGVLIESGIRNFNAMGGREDDLKIHLLIMDKSIRFHFFPYRVLAQFFTYGSKEYSHSVAVVIDTENECCYIVDSLSSSMSYLHTLKSALCDLPGYSQLVIRGKTELKSDPYAAVHTIVNIIGIISGSICNKTGAGMAQAEMESPHVVTLIQAWESTQVKRANQQELLRSFLVKKSLISQLKTLTDPAREKDISIFLEQLSKEIACVNNDRERLWMQRLFPKFLLDFTESHPDNSFAGRYLQDFYAQLIRRGDISERYINDSLSNFLKTMPSDANTSSIGLPAASSSSPELLLPTKRASLAQFFKGDPISEGRNQYALRECLITLYANLTEDIELKNSLLPLFQALDAETKISSKIAIKGGTNIQALSIFLLKFYDNNPENKSSILFTTEEFGILLSKLDTIKTIDEKKLAIDEYLKKQLAPKAELSVTADAVVSP